MPEIILPTKATQDLIKTDTTNILSNFPINGGTDFLALTYANTGTTTTHGAESVLNITGQGIITTVIGHNNAQVDLTYQIDGGAIFLMSIPQAHGFSVFIPFSTSIVMKCSSSTYKPKIFYGLV